MLYRELIDRYGDYFTGSMGAEAIQKLAADFDVEAEADNLPDTIRHLAGSTTDEQPPLQRPGSAYLSLWRMGSIGYGNQGDSGAGVLAFQWLERLVRQRGELDIY